MKTKLLFLLFIVQFGFGQQRTCGTKQFTQELLSNPDYQRTAQELQAKFKHNLIDLQNKKNQRNAGLNYTTQTIRIPVAVHFPSQGAATDQQKTCLRTFAQTQVNILNADYNATNADISNWTAASSNYTGVNIGDMDVEFVLATQNHPSSSGIANNVVAVTFGTDYLNNANTDPTWIGYLNIVVRNISGGVLGYSPLGGNPQQGQTVVIDDNAFSSGTGCGTISPSFPYNKGRTLTHELGHFFNLEHTFNECDNGSCSESGDFVCDTPPVSDPYYACSPAGSVASSCGPVPQLTMNYMDYVQDSCMYMFTAGQVERMQAWYQTIQSQLLTTVLQNDSFDKVSFTIYPNPTKGKINIKLDNLESDYTVAIYDSLGRDIQYTHNKLTNEIDLENNATGIYFINIKTNNGQITKKIVIE